MVDGGKFNGILEFFLTAHVRSACEANEIGQEFLWQKACTFRSAWMGELEKLIDTIGFVFRVSIGQIVADSLDVIHFRFHVPISCASDFSGKMFKLLLLSLIWDVRRLFSIYYYHHYYYYHLLIACWCVWNNKKPKKKTTKNLLAFEERLVFNCNCRSEKATLFMRGNNFAAFRWPPKNSCENEDNKRWIYWQSQRMNGCFVSIHGQWKWSVQLKSRTINTGNVSFSLCSSAHRNDRKFFITSFAISIWTLARNAFADYKCEASRRLWTFAKVLRTRIDLNCLSGSKFDLQWSVSVHWFWW